LFRVTGHDKETTMKRSERGFTLVEIMIVVAIIALLAAIAIPNVLRGRATANESAAIGNLRALVSSVEMFRSVQQTYPATNTFNRLYQDAAAGGAAPDCALATLPNPDYGPPSFCSALTGVAGVPPAGSDVQGYRYTYVGAAAPAQTYDVVAVPINVGTTGTRGFCVDHGGTPRHCPCPAGACAVTPQALGAGCATAMSTIDAAPDMNNATAAIDTCA
jgi:prepilin-type N-terminal cleavage/methylation domain-containing protein